MAKKRPKVDSLPTSTTANGKTKSKKTKKKGKKKASSSNGSNTGAAATSKGTSQASSSASSKRSTNYSDVVSKKLSKAAARRITEKNFLDLFDAATILNARQRCLWNFCGEIRIALTSPSSSNPQQPAQPTDIGLCNVFHKGKRFSLNLPQTSIISYHMDLERFKVIPLQHLKVLYLEPITDDTAAKLTYLYSLIDKERCVAVVDFQGDRILALVPSRPEILKYYGLSEEFDERKHLAVIVHLTDEEIPLHGSTSTYYANDQEVGTTLNPETRSKAALLDLMSKISLNESQISDIMKILGKKMPPSTETHLNSVPPPTHQQRQRAATDDSREGIRPPQQNPSQHSRRSPAASVHSHSEPGFNDYRRVAPPHGGRSPSPRRQGVYGAPPSPSHQQQRPYRQTFNRSSRDRSLPPTAASHHRPHASRSSPPSRAHMYRGGSLSASGGPPPSSHYSNVDRRRTPSPGRRQDRPPRYSPPPPDRTSAPMAPSSHYPNTSDRRVPPPPPPPPSRVRHDQRSTPPPGREHVRLPSPPLGATVVKSSHTPVFTTKSLSNLPTQDGHPQNSMQNPRKRKRSNSPNNNPNQPAKRRHFSLDQLEKGNVAPNVPHSSPSTQQTKNNGKKISLSPPPQPMRRDRKPKHQGAHKNQDSQTPTKNLWVGLAYSKVKVDGRMLQRDFSKFSSFKSFNYLYGQKCAFINYGRVEDAVAAKKQYEGTAKYPKITYKRLGAKF